MLLLRVESDPSAAPRPLPAGSTTVVGRSFDCDIVISHESVSRRHAKIVVEGGKTLLVGLSNGNPVLRNGQPVTETTLSAGDKLRFGKVDAIVEELPDGEGAGIELPDGPPTDQPTYLRVDALVKGTALNVDGKRVVRLLSEIARTLVA